MSGVNLQVHSRFLTLTTLGFLAVAILFSISPSAQTVPFDPAHANSFFEEAKRVADKDNGKLWGRKLYGPIFFVDHQTRTVIANQADAEGLLRRNGKVFVGKLPKDIVPSNTPTSWGGTRWTMLIWETLPKDRQTREQMFTHELFHRIQDELKLSPADALNLHLDSLEGRLWLQLEWRALAAALIAQGSAQDLAIKDALAFRNYRQKLFTGSAETERSLEIAEGVPEYTGVRVAAPDSPAANWSTAGRLTSPDLSISFVRSFAYTSGPAYGLLLDQRLPSWRTKLSAQSDLGAMLASTIKDTETKAEERTSVYGAASIRIAEKDRAEKVEATKAHYRKLLVDGPTLTLPGSKNFKFTFNPSTVISLDDKGAVYPTFHASGPWGTLEVSDGALVPQNFNQVTVTAPTKSKGTPLEGHGWKLNLLPGWRIATVTGTKSFTVVEETK